MKIYGKIPSGLALAGGFMLLAAPAAWGQATDLVCSGCVQGTDIANGTIGTNKFIPGSINATVIANGSIGTNKLIPGSINTVTIATDAIRSNKILDGAVTNAKIAAGAVTAAALAADAVFGRILVVRADPIDQVGNCGELQAVLANLTDNDADNRYLIHLEPGIYDCDTHQVFMKPYIDIQGSGRATTLIRSNFISPLRNSGAIMGADNAELRSLTIEHVATAFVGPAVLVYTNGSSMRVTDVDLIATGPNANQNFIAEGGGFPTLTNVFLSAKGVALVGAGANQFPLVCGSGGTVLTLVNVTSIVEGGSNNEALLASRVGCVVTARNSVFKGSLGSVSAGLGTANLVGTQLDGPISEGFGTLNCVGAYDGNFSPLDSGCNAIP